MTIAIPRSFAIPLLGCPAGARQHDLLEIWRGLSATPRRLPCKLLYDAHGARLFERITHLEEYYLTRSELEILVARAGEIAARVGPQAVLVEFGSGSARKTRPLLDALAAPRAYVPIDVSTEMLAASVRGLEARYPGLDVRPVPADYMREYELPLSHEEKLGPVLAFFPGSTIGNLEPDEVRSFLQRMRAACGPRVELLVGVDLPKERARLESAYDDALGITARFNLNVLRVLNRTYGGRLRVRDFVHRALWNAAACRVEMQLVSRRDQTVCVGGRSFALRAGEPIVTEHCYKYSLAGFRRLVASAGFDVREVWLDAAGAFSVQRIAPAGSSRAPRG